MSAPGGEEGFLDRWLRPHAGPGTRGFRDDAAVLTPAPGFDLVVTSDALVLGVHAFPEDAPEDVAAKALAVNLSDLAAKGARPLGCSLALGWREGGPEWGGRFLDAFAGQARGLGCPLVGGDLTATSGPAFAAVTAFGEARPGRCPSRAGGRAGDAVLVSGTLGDAALGLILRREPARAAAWGLGPVEAAHLLARYLRPTPRLALAPLVADLARASMDLSDGLLGDLARLARASGLAAEVAAEAVPLSPAARLAVGVDPGAWRTILTGGDDYELLVCVPPDLAGNAAERAREVGVPLTAIGRLVPGMPGEVRATLNGQPLAYDQLAYTHL